MQNIVFSRLREKFLQISEAANTHNLTAQINCSVILLHWIRKFIFFRSRITTSEAIMGREIPFDG